MGDIERGYMKEKAKKVWGKVLPWIKKKTPYFCIALVSVFTLSVFLNNGYPDGHDLEYHAASVIGISKKSFFEVLTNKIDGVVSNDFGYGEGLFYPPLAHMTAAIIYKIIAPLGLSVFAAFRIFYFIVLFCSGVFMYKLVFLVVKNKKAALFASFFYVAFPYIITDIVIRCAMAESAIFVFMPMTLVGLYYLLQNDYRKFLIFFTLGCIGMVHSHLVLTLYFAIFCIIGFLPKIKIFFSKRKLIFLAISILFSVLISAPFLLPMLENKNNADYYVFMPGFMSSSKNLQDWRVPIDALFSIDKPIGNVPVFMSLFGAIAIIYAVVQYRKIKNTSNAIFFLFSLIVTILGIICSSTLFSWENVHSVFLLIQFPFRLMSFSALGMALLIGLIIPSLEKEYGNIIYIIVALSCIYGVSQVNNTISVTKEISVEGLKHSASYIIDYLPTSSPATQENNYINTREHDVLATDESVVISNITENVPDISFTASEVNKPTSILIPRYYYLGYQILASYQDGSKAILSYNMSDDGCISFLLEKNADIIITYPGTLTQKIAYGVAMLSAILFVGFLVAIKKMRFISDRK